MPGKFFSPSPSPSPTLPPMHSPLSNLSSLAAVSTNELSSLPLSQQPSLSPSPNFANENSSSLSPSPNSVNENSFLKEAEKIIAMVGQLDRAVLRAELIVCANRFTIEKVIEVLRHISKDIPSAWFIAITEELFAQHPQSSLVFRANSLVCAMRAYACDEDLDGARSCIARLVEMNVSINMSGMDPHNDHPIYYAVLYEAAALICLKRPDSRDQTKNESKICDYRLHAVYFAALGKKVAYAKEIADLYLKDTDISELLEQAQDMELYAKNPCFCGIMFELIINKFLSDGPSSTERGVIKRHNDKLILYFKSAIYSYAIAEDIPGLKRTLLAYRSFDESGRLFTILRNDTSKRSGMSLILQVLKNDFDSDDSNYNASMRP